MLVQIHVHNISWTIERRLVSSTTKVGNKWFKRNSWFLTVSSINIKKKNNFGNSLLFQKENMNLAVTSDNFTEFEIKKILVIFLNSNGLIQFNLKIKISNHV